MVHTSIIGKDNKQSGLPTDNKIYGRHGDLKPENILWFKDHDKNSRECPMGVLQIADFGFADFHSKDSVSNVESTKFGMSPTYRAPEYDQGGISQSYDIWSFGCVLLEFVTWYMLGWGGVEGFSMRRVDDSIVLPPKVREDNFFNVVQSAGGSEALGKGQAIAKKSVLTVSILYKISGISGEKAILTERF